MLPTIAQPDNDPRLWLEEIDGEAALHWVKAQNEQTLATYGGPEFEKDRDALAALMDRDDKIAIVSRRGDFLYNFWTDGKNPRGLWRRTTFQSYCTQSPQWDTIVDLDALAAQEGKDWIWRAAIGCRDNPDQFLLKLSVGGADAVVIREFDLRTKSFVEGGFELPEAKQSALWADQNTVLVTSTLGENHATQSGYARTVRRWVRGQSFEKAKVIYEVPFDHLGCEVQIDHDVIPNRIVFGDWLSFFDEAWLIGDINGPHHKLDLPTDAMVFFEQGHIAYRLRSEATIAGQTYAPDTLLGDRLSRVLEGKHAPKLLFSPSERCVLQHFQAVDGRWYLTISDNLTPVIKALRPEGDEWHDEPLPNLPKGEMISLWPFDAGEKKSNGDMLVMTEGPLSPPNLSLYKANGEATQLKQSPALFNAEGLVTERFEAMSDDGTLIPYSVVGPAKKTGKAPVLLTGYGGFQIALEPHYSGAVGKLWLEKGGTFVQANLRGGGEFGSRWHKAGMREGKSLSHDDFAAVAHDLVKRGISQPRHIAAEGGSNGGLLIINMLTRYPERFGALFCTIPLIDMYRYTKLLAGASWEAEYGNPYSDDWAFMQRFSAYHHDLNKDHYPPILIATSQRDDRVHPGHARKMAHKAQSAGLNCAFYEPADGGHGYGKTSKERASFTALGYGFLGRQVGL